MIRRDYILRMIEEFVFAVAFYERLRGKGDAALEAGNLPRSELEAGLAELRKRLAG